MNKVILTGRLTKDPELRYTARSGKAVVRFSIAVKRPLKKDEVDFINCIAFDKRAETIAQHFSKGSGIIVNGNIRTGSYDAQDGTKRYTTDIIVEDFEFMGGKKSESKSEEIDFTPVEDDGEMPF